MLTNEEVKEYQIKYAYQYHEKAIPSIAIYKSYFYYNIPT